MNEKSNGSYNWVDERPYNPINHSNKFKVELDLEIDMNMENILLR